MNILRSSALLAFIAIALVGPLKAQENASPSPTTQPVDSDAVYGLLLEGKAGLRLSSDDRSDAKQFSFVLSVQLSKQTAVETMVSMQSGRTVLVQRTQEGLPLLVGADGFTVGLDTQNPGGLVVGTKWYPHVIVRAAVDGTGITLNAGADSKLGKSALDVDLRSLLIGGTNQSIAYEPLNHRLRLRRQSATCLITVDDGSQAGRYPIREFVIARDDGRTVGIYNLSVDATPSWARNRIDAESVRALGLPIREMANDDGHRTEAGGNGGEVALKNLDPGLLVDSKHRAASEKLRQLIDGKMPASVTPSGIRR